MPAVDEQEVAAVRVYARALLQLAQEAGEERPVLEELEELEGLLDRDPAFGRFLSDPQLEPRERRGALDRILRDHFSERLVDTLQVMNAKGRLGLVRALREAYARDLKRVEGRVDVEVATAVPLSEELRERLRDAAARFTGGRVDLHERVDASVVGGLVLRVGDRKVDRTVAKELRRVGRRLLERASTEIHGGRGYAADGA